MVDILPVQLSLICAIKELAGLYMLVTFLSIPSFNASLSILFHHKFQQFRLKSNYYLPFLLGNDPGFVGFGVCNFSLVLLLVATPTASLLRLGPALFFFFLLLVARLAQSIVAW